MTPQWAKDAFFYHIYPLGLLDAPGRNDFNKPVTHRLPGLDPWLAHIQSLGANAIYLGPVFQSTSHGYDTVDYYQVDRRLGKNKDLGRFVASAHHRGLRVVLDGIFNHVGRDFWAFQDLLDKGEQSAYLDWFHNLRFGERSPKGDPFTYEGWHGHTSLVKLNLSHPEVRSHLFAAIQMWIEKFEIDGLRLDAADCIDLDFLRAMRQFTGGLNESFWLMGEVVHGDYREWANPETLHSVTNYECYKGLYSSLVDRNYHEIAYGLNRQFGPDGLYRDLDLYNFVDNHDVDRVASKLGNPALLYPLYLLLFTIPGAPSVYYGSEWGIEGVKEKWSDAPLRPSLDLMQISDQAPSPDLSRTIASLASIRTRTQALRMGNYRPLDVRGQQLVFVRESQEERVWVLINSASEWTEMDLNQPHEGTIVRDLLDPGYENKSKNGVLRVKVPPTWGRILQMG